MASPKTTKDLAERIDPTYFTRRHRLRRLRRRLTVALLALTAAAAALVGAVGDKRAYANGPIAAGHALFEADCGTCHTEAFGPVYDASCLSCHTTPGHANVDEPACASCHPDHRGADELARVGDQACHACHTSHRQITVFATHADFRPADVDQKLAFDHKAHLDGDLVGGPLDCGACHVREGGDFRPVRFAEHCAACHTDRLDPDVADEVVPHGLQPEELRAWIAARLVDRMRADGTLVRSIRTERAAPGGGGGAPPTWTEALRERTDAAVDALLTPGRAAGCLLCHTLDHKTRIAKPQVPATWLPAARFDHKTHEFESCDRCHDMSNNTKASDLKLPGIATCRDCHKKGGARTSCTTCHTYHRGVGGR